MEYLRLSPERFKKRIHLIKTNEYDFVCLSILNNHMDVVPYYDYLLSMNAYNLKNLWNYIVNQWNITQKMLSSHKNFKLSSYSKMHYEYDFTEISYDELDMKISNFIKGDKMKALYVVQSIQNYLFP